VLAEPAALLLLVTKTLGNGKPLERFFEFTLMCRNDARQRWRKLGTHRHFAFAFVGKVKKLRDNLRPAFFRVEFRRLQHGSIPLDEAVSTRHFPPAVEDVIASGAILWKKITEAWKRLHALLKVENYFRGVRLFYLIRRQANESGRFGKASLPDADQDSHCLRRQRNEGAVE
jgi:hypothetical protein